MAYAVKDGAEYTYGDLDWLRDELGVAHIELDPWGCLIVTPASDEHDTAVALMHAQALRQLALPDGCVRGNGTGWIVPGGSGYLNVPDLIVVDPTWTRVDELHIDPPPLLVVEVASRSTRRVDRTRKLDDYRLGRAGFYLLVDLPTDGPPAFVAHDFAAGKVTSAIAAIDVVVAGGPLRFDLSQLA
jgi:Uma2 family endonuclease